VGKRVNSFKEQEIGRWYQEDKQRNPKALKPRKNTGAGTNLE
jgi:hypothetical protein